MTEDDWEKIFDEWETPEEKEEYEEKEVSRDGGAHLVIVKA